MFRLSTRRGLLVVAAVLLVALAGCSGLSGDTTPTADETPTANGTENATTTPAPSPESSTPTPSPEGSTPTDTAPDQQTPTEDSESATDLEANGTGADLDGEALDDATRTAVEDAGSYTYQSAVFTVSQSQRGRSITRQNTTAQVDLEAEQGLRVSNLTIASQRSSQEFSATVYTDGNTSYRQRITSQGTNYSTQEGTSNSTGAIIPVNTSGFAPNLTFVTDGLVWEANGTTTVDGDTVTEYTLAGLEDQNSFTESPRATLTGISGTLYVDDDDVVRQFSLTYEAESRAGTSTSQQQFRLSELGSTTVEEPDWTSGAEETDSS
jgi:hypothetical protein